MKVLVRNDFSQKSMNNPKLGKEISTNLKLELREFFVTPMSLNWRLPMMKLHHTSSAVSEKRKSYQLSLVGKTKIHSRALDLLNPILFAARITPILAYSKNRQVI